MEGIKGIRVMFICSHSFVAIPYIPLIPVKNSLIFAASLRLRGKIDLCRYSPGKIFETS